MPLAAVRRRRRAFLPAPRRFRLAHPEKKSCGSRMSFACRLSRLFFLLFACGGLLASAADYKGAIVIDADSGQTVFADNADVVSPPASVTKLMTFLLVHDRLAGGSLTL